MYNLVLVGGTGQQFGHILGWLNLLGLVEPPSKTIVVDANLSSFHSKMVENLSYANPNHENIQVRPYVAQGSVTLPEAIQTNVVRSPFIKLLFSDSERSLPLANGFYANPKLGSTVFSHLQQEDNIANKIKSGTKNLGKTIVVGSVSGGTGAGLMYSIARQLFEARGKQISNVVQSPIIGFVFSKYIMLDNDEADGNDVTNAQLTNNAQNGTRFLWQRSKEDPSFPFDMLDFFGPPGSDNDERFCPRANEGEVMPFPGFLLAAQLLGKQRFEDLWHGLTTHLGNFAANPEGTNDRFFGVHVHAVHNDIEERYVNGASTVFNGLNCTDLPIYLQTIKKVLSEIEKYDVRTALSPFALWPLRRLPKEIVDYLTRENNYISRRQITDAFSSIHQVPRYLTPNLFRQNAGTTSTFFQWFDLLRTYGYFGENIQESPRIKESPWYKHLPQDIANLSEGNAKIIIRKICEAQITGQGMNAIDSQGASRWAFPYISQPRPNALGRQNLHTYNLSLDCESHTDSSGVCFPTPLGRVEAFKEGLLRALTQEHSSIYQEAKILWYALVLGEIQVKTIKLSEGSNLEKLIAAFEKVDTLGILIDHDGNIIGGTHPECGLWSGVAGIDNEKLRQVINNPQLEIEALSIISYWLGQVETRVNGHQPAWLKFLRNLVDTTPYQAQVQQKLHHLTNMNVGTHTSIKLSMGNAIVEDVYLYHFSPLRRQQIAHLIYKLASGSEEFTSVVVHEDGMKYIHCLHDNEKVASISLGSPRDVYAPHDAQDVIAEGCFTVVLSDIYPISAFKDNENQLPLHEALSELIINRWPQQHGLNLQVIYQQLLQRQFKPEIFWA